MKHILITLTFILISFSTFAKGPQLATEKLFDGRYNENPKVEWSKIKRDGKIAYYLNFKYDPAIIKDVMDALTKDLNGEEFETEIITKDNTYYKAEIERNGGKIEMGFSIPKKGECSLFIRGPRKAFE